jgi:hypothetical protein
MQASDGSGGNIGARIVRAEITSILAAWRINAQYRRRLHQNASRIYRNRYNRLMWPQYIINAIITSSAVTTLVEDLGRKEDKGGEVDSTTAALIVAMSVTIFALSLVDFILSRIMQAKRYDLLSRQQVKRAAQYSKVSFEIQTTLLKLSVNPSMKMQTKMGYLFNIMAMVNDMRDDAGQYQMPRELEAKLAKSELSPTFVPQLTEEEIKQVMLEMQEEQDSESEHTEGTEEAEVTRQMVSMMTDESRLSVEEQDEATADDATGDMHTYTPSEVIIAVPPTVIMSGTGRLTGASGDPPRKSDTDGTGSQLVMQTIREWYQQAIGTRSKKSVFVRAVAKKLYRSNVIIVVLRSILTFVSFINGALESRHKGQNTSDFGQSLVVIIIVVSALRSAISHFVSAIKWQEEVFNGLQHDRELLKFQQRIRMAYDRLSKAPKAYSEILHQLSKMREELIENNVFDTGMNLATLTSNPISV